MTAPTAVMNSIKTSHSVWTELHLQSFAQETKSADLRNRIADWTLMKWTLTNVSSSINKLSSCKRLQKTSQQEKCQDLWCLLWTENWPIDALLETESRLWVSSVSLRVTLNLIPVLTNKSSSTSKGATSKSWAFNLAWTQMDLLTLWALRCQTSRRKIRRNLRRWRETQRSMRRLVRVLLRQSMVILILRKPLLACFLEDALRSFLMVWGWEVISIYCSWVIHLLPSLNSWNSLTELPLFQCTQVEKDPQLLVWQHRLSKIQQQEISNLKEEPWCLLMVESSASMSLIKWDLKTE